MDAEDFPNKDTLVVVLSDMHSGGTTALFQNEIQYFKHGNHTPTAEQVAMFEHFEKCARLVSVLRKGKRLIIVHDGDAIDGVHHKSPQSVTTIKNEQIKIHVDLMKHFLKLAKFKESDKLYYIVGTETHTDDNEDECARMMGAGRAYDELNLPVNGIDIWFAHKGPSAGKGANQGNSLYNFIRDLWIDSDENPPPDVAIFGHVHTPRYRVFSRVVKGKIKKLEGWIVPSWQMKTRFAYGVAAMQTNSIGMAHFEVTKKGNIVNQNFCIM